MSDSHRETVELGRVGPASLLNAIDPRFLVVISRAIMALSAPVVAFLILEGPSLAGGVVEPVSFCNILFIGNLCAAMVVSAHFGFKPIVRDLTKLETRTKALLVLMGASAAALSALIFMALETTSVANSVLLGRVGPVLYAFAGVVLLNAPIKRAEWYGFGFIALGVVATVFSSSGFKLVRGDVLILVSSIFYALTLYLSKAIGKACSLRAMVFARNVISAFVFFCVAIYLFGVGHFEDALSGQLWIVMLIYALVIVVSSQFTWYAAVQRLEPSTVAKWTVLTPVMGIVFAYFINDQLPTMAQVIGLALVSVGIWITSFCGAQERRPKTATECAEASLAAH